MPLRYIYDVYRPMLDVCKAIHKDARPFLIKAFRVRIHTVHLPPILPSQFRARIIELHMRARDFQRLLPNEILANFKRLQTLHVLDGFVDFHRLIDTTLFPVHIPQVTDTELINTIGYHDNGAIELSCRRCTHSLYIFPNKHSYTIMLHVRFVIQNWTCQSPIAEVGDVVTAIDSSYVA